MSDRRRAQRVKASFPVRFAKHADGEPALLRDISEIGLACISPDAIAEMTLVALAFSLPGATELHQVKGAVVRCEPMTGEYCGKFDVAVYFTEITPVTRAALKNYVGKANPRHYC